MCGGMFCIYVGDFTSLVREIVSKRETRAQCMRVDSPEYATSRKLYMLNIAECDVCEDISSTAVS